MKVSMDRKRFQDLCKLGAWSTFIAGGFYCMMVICAFILPRSIATYQATQEYFFDFQIYKSLFLFLKWSMFLSSIAMIGVVYSIYNLARESNKTIIGFFSLLAVIGYAFNLFQSILDLSQIPSLVEGYRTSSANVQEVITVMGVSNVSLFVLSMGLPGLWAIAVSSKAITNKEVPRFIPVLGFLWGLGNIATVFAHVFVILPLIYLIALGAMICTPVWAIYEGVFFMKIMKKGLSYIKLTE